jgi:hypothetical protein
VQTLALRCPPKRPFSLPAAVFQLGLCFSFVGDLRMFESSVFTPRKEKMKTVLSINHEKKEVLMSILRDFEFCRDFEGKMVCPHDQNQSIV